MNRAPAYLPTSCGKFVAQYVAGERVAHLLSLDQARECLQGHHDAAERSRHRGEFSAYGRHRADFWALHESIRHLEAVNAGRAA